MHELLPLITTIVNSTTGKPMLELAKNKWIKFCVGIAIISYPASHLITTIITALR